MSGDTSVAMFARECSVEGCRRRRSYWGLSDACSVHTILRNARGMSPEDLAEVQVKIQDIVPMTKAERRKLSRQSALRQIEQDARSAQRLVERARSNGATSRQIAAAQRRGTEKAS